MTCAPDAFNNLMGLIVLKPGEVKEFTFGVKLK
jgi:galactose mutarotase-like enzyme